MGRAFGFGSELRTHSLGCVAIDMFFSALSCQGKAIKGTCWNGYICKDGEVLSFDTPPISLDTPRRTAPAPPCLRWRCVFQAGQDDAASWSRAHIHSTWCLLVWHRHAVSRLTTRLSALKKTIGRLETCGNFAVRILSVVSLGTWLTTTTSSSAEGSSLGPDTTGTACNRFCPQAPEGLRKAFLRSGSRLAWGTPSLLLTCHTGTRTDIFDGMFVRFMVAYSPPLRDMLTNTMLWCSAKGLQLRDSRIATMYKCLVCCQ